MSDAALAAAVDRELGRGDEQVAELLELIRVPSVSVTGEGIPEAVELVGRHLRDAGLEVTTTATDGHPIVLGRGAGREGAPAVLIYGHYDVFPPGDPGEWSSDPFEPVVDGGVIRGRGAGDNKGQFHAHVAALKLLRRMAPGLPVNVTVLLEGEEEIGSPSLPGFVEANRDALAADLCFYSDGPMFPGDQPVILHGARGALCVDVVARGPARDLHSGNFGGIAPNPALELCHFLAAVAGPDSSLRARGADAGAPIVGDRDAAVMERLPFDRSAVEGAIGVPPLADERREAYERLMYRPCVSVSGLAGGHTGEGVRPIIPSEASAKLDIRLVGDQQPDAVLEALRELARDLGLDRLEIERYSGYPASRTPFDHPYAEHVRGATAAGFGREPLTVPSLGGTTPEYLFTRELGCPAALVPYAPFDEGNHGPNELTRISTFLSGIRTTALLLAGLGGRPEAPEHGDSALAGSAR